ncbi:MAG: hypothetical protein SGJ17_06310 [Hyphomicrobiales bacterium]|nr:hypothetical protein [Hyphomicrobiales bacterium]
MAAPSYQINNSVSATITEHFVCRDVTNTHSSGQAIFVPTNTAAEWASFYNNTPAGVTATPCDVRIYLTTGTTWTVPASWSSSNTIEVIGGGAAGKNGSNNRMGGGGGAYSRISNLSLTPGASIS